MKISIDNFMDEIIKNKHEVDIINTSDFNIINNLFIEDKNYSKKESIIINNKTILLSFSNSLKKISTIFDDIIQNGFNFNSLLASELFIYIKDLDMIMMQSGASHRLSALYLYLNKKNNSIVVKKKYLKFKIINIELLAKLKIDIKQNKIYYLDEEGYKNIQILYSKHSMNFILKLQKKYLGDINILSLPEKLKYKYVYKYHPINKLINSSKNIYL